MRPYFRGGRVSETNEVGALEGTTVSLNGGRSPHFFPKKVRFVKILSLFVLLCGAQFHRATTLRTPRELPETAKTKKVRFLKISFPCTFPVFLVLITKDEPKTNLG